MRDWIKEHIEEAAQNKVVASDTEQNSLLADVIEVLKLLVKYGYYDDVDDVEAVLRPLLEVLNGFTDLPFPPSEDDEISPLLPQDEGKSWQESSSAQAVHSWIKIALIQLLLRRSSANAIRRFHKQEKVHGNC